MANFERALAPARRGAVDLVIHGGDLFHRSRVSAGVAEAAMERLYDVTDAGVPVCLLPGNHERSRIPYRLLTWRPGLHLLDHPRTVRLSVAGVRVAVAGFPFHRRVSAGRFEALVAATGALETPADLRLLCFHQAVEGAVVGAQNYVFRRGSEVIAQPQLPPDFAAFLTGHIHRAQILRQGLSGRAFPAPVVYPGSTSRTSFAERDEEKSVSLLDFEPGPRGGRLRRLRRIPLPSRPMIDLSLRMGGRSRRAVIAELRARLATVDEDAIVRVHALDGPDPNPDPVEGELTAASLRSVAPPTMNIDLARPARRGRAPVPASRPPKPIQSEIR